MKTKLIILILSVSFSVFAAEKTTAMKPCPECNKTCYSKKIVSSGSHSQGDNIVVQERIAQFKCKCGNQFTGRLADKVIVNVPAIEFSEVKKTSKASSPKASK